MAEPNIFELAELGSKADTEKNRQAGEFARLGVEPPKEANINVFQQAEADLKKQPKEAPTEESPGFLRKAYNFMGGRTGLGATGGSLIATAFAPETGGLSFLIPVLGAALGGAGGAATEGKNPLKEALKEGAMQGVFHGAQRAAKPVWQFAKDSLVKTLGSRELVSEAAERLLKKWMNPMISAKQLYEQAEATQAVIPLFETARTVKDLLKEETNRMPLDVQGEIKRVLGPIQNFTSVGRGKGQQYVMSQNVADAMADVRRLRLEASKAYDAGNSDLGLVINKARAALLNDLEKAGVPEVKLASQAARKEMAIEDLSKLIAKPMPGVKIRDFARSNPLFKGAFNKTEEAQIDRIVKKLTFVAPTGGAGVLGKAATTGLGMATGGAVAGTLGTEIGAAIGFFGSEYIRTLLASPWGRNFIERTLADTYKMGPAKAANYLAPMWSAAARGLTRPGETEQ